MVLVDHRQFYVLHVLIGDEREQHNRHNRHHDNHLRQKLVAKYLLELFFQ